MWPLVDGIGTREPEETETLARRREKDGTRVRDGRVIFTRLISGGF